MRKYVKASMSLSSENCLITFSQHNEGNQSAAIKWLGADRNEGGISNNSLLSK